MMITVREPTENEEKKSVLFPEKRFDASIRVLPEKKATSIRKSIRRTVLAIRHHLLKAVFLIFKI